MRRRRTAVALVSALVVAVVVVGLQLGGGGSPVASPDATRPVAEPAASAAVTAGHLAPGSDPSVLPASLLIADEGNDRLVMVNPQGQVTWTFPQPGDLPPGVEFRTPDDAFFTPDGRQIIATEEEFSVVTLIDIRTRRIVWRYGAPGTPGSAVNQLSNPDDALVLPDGYVLTADIKNCRLLLIAPRSHVPSRIYGTTTSACRHDPPARFGSPNGAFPMGNGHYLVTEINGDWVDEMDLAGRIYGSWHPPGVAYPSDSNEVSPGVYLTVDYSSPGQIETFDRSGRLLWRYRPAGPDALNKPSLALPLPNGDVIATDDSNDRVIVVDPRTDRVVWQYGVRGQPGSAPGLLDDVDGLDLAPPHSELVHRAPAMGLPG
ncbi:MAG TPA: PQQ-binding-like beta-propeller repeat protein [Acidimicrobiales bacterium]|nr:PQQ-binding-like beta-propeller repeat protein [Acidimicrobiales bacterium]